MNQMKCPRCGRVLERTFFERKIAYRCPGGHGCSMTLPAVRSLCGRPEFVNTLWRMANDNPSGMGSPCPECGRPMSLVRLPLGGRELELDVCCRCQELWFDPDELERVPKPPPPPPKPELPEKAREILAMHAIANMKAELEPEPGSMWGYAAGFLGFPVEQGAPPRTSRPWCTWAVAAICLAVHLLAFRNLEGCADKFGLIPGQWLRGGGLTFITSMFLHGGFWHLLGNLYFLLIFGDNVEDALGAPRYLLLALLSGLAAGLLHVALFPSSMVPCIGASGFISGVIAAYAVFFPKVSISFFIRPWGGFVGRWVALPAWGAFVLWMLLQGGMALCTLSLSGRAAGIAYGAHLGGALFGLAAGFFFRQRVRRRIECLEDEWAGKGTAPESVSHKERKGRKGGKEEGGRMAERERES